MSNKSGASEQIISLPEGGGALHGLGEKFSPDLYTGTGNFSVPVSLPAGRNGFQPQLNLVYSTGNGNGPFGLGWSLSIPGVSRKASQGVPRYRDYDPGEEPDVFVLSGAEDLVPMGDIVGDGASDVTRYRPRTEGLFARIEHHHNEADDFWEVRSKDGLVSVYGTPGTRGGADPAAIARDGAHKFAWKLTETRDPFGNRIAYTYAADAGQVGPHAWQQPLLSRIDYAEYSEAGNTRYLISVSFDYGGESAARPDPLSDYRAGFEIRTTRRCASIKVETHFDQVRAVREYRFTYDNTALNGVSLLRQIDVIGYDDEGHAYDGSDPQYELQLPPLTFDYTRFEPGKQRFTAVSGAQLPAQSLAAPTLELADLTGDGLPDILEMNGAVRYWRNLGDGRFDLPRPMRDAPAVQLADPGVQMLDADGDGRIELMVTAGPLAGYYPLNADGTWDARSYRPYRYAPSFDLENPEVRLLDLDGDGVTDALRTGTGLECFFNDPHDGWDPARARPVARRALAEFPDVAFSDPRVKLGDMTGDGLQDIVLLHNGRVDYWPNLGHGNWGRRVTMTGCPHFDDPGYSLGYDPKRVLLGDVDGDGLADLVYVANHKVTLWINRSGNGWSNPIEIRGTPSVTDMDAVRLVDLLGSGIGGVLWSADASGNGRPHMHFLDFTGGVKPHLMDEMDNHLGATTRVEYAPSTRFSTADREARRPWRTTLPFPVQVVAAVEVIDHLSHGKLTTEYRYHEGYWDGAEREFRGFGMVEQLDTETFERYNADGLHGGETPFDPVDGARQQFFAPPTLTRTWFHQGPVGPARGDWLNDLDLSDSYWPGDPGVFDPWGPVNQFLVQALAGARPDQRRARRDALRALRGSMLRTEFYALDRYANQDRIDPLLDRPYTVTESQHGLAEIEPPDAGQARLHIFFAHTLVQRITQWERGNDPMTQCTFTSYLDEAGQFDAFGRPRTQMKIACPRGWHAAEDRPTKEYLATRTCTDYAERNDALFMVDRVKRVTTYGYRQADTVGKTLAELVAAASGDPMLKCIGQTANYYDGFDPDTAPTAYGQLGNYGALTLAETLAFDEEILTAAYGSQRPPYFATGAITWPAEYPAGFRTWMTGLPGRAGYVRRDHATLAHYQTGYYTVARSRYDVQDNPAAGRGLVVAQYDPLGHATTITYDHQLLPKTVRDPVALETTADYNYRVMQPSLVTDPNGNHTAVRYSPAGLPLSIAVVGKQGGCEGDRRREAAAGATPLDYPSQYFQYDMRAYLVTEALPPEQRDPVYVRSLTRQEHFWDIVNTANAARRAAGQADLTQSEIDALFPANEIETHPERFIETRQYSDGFGRALQGRTQGETQRFGDAVFGNGLVPAGQGDAHDRDAVTAVENTSVTAPNVIVSGWQSYDNKGRTVEKYEPYFDTGWDYDPPASPQGIKVTMFYDPLGQVVRTLSPDGSEQRVIYGVPGSIAQPDLDHADAAGQIVYEPTPWEAYTYDPNDLAPLSHAPDGTPLAGRAPASHHYTPSNVIVDALGRPMRAVQRLSQTQEAVTRSEYDLLGNMVKSVDALSRNAFVYVFDLGKRELSVTSIDAGQRLIVYDAAGNAIESRDSKGSLLLHSYDALNRPAALWARNATGRPVTLREQLAYGDGGDPNQLAADRQANRLLNRLGELASHHDEAGTLTLERYDFKGNLLNQMRQVVADAALVSGQVFEMDWDHPPVLDAAEYGSGTTYDALNRVVSGTQTVKVGSTVTTSKTLKPHYNRGGALESVSLDGVAYVMRIAYNARGQRTLVAYGNGMLTRYAYDPRTFRLARLRTEGYTASGMQYLPTGTVRQDFAYEYDLAGNIAALHDRTPACGLPAQPDRLDRLFTYDPFYRLLTAGGREINTVPPSSPWSDPARGGGVAQARTYLETYTYDLAGNMLKLVHTAGSLGSFTRTFTVRADSNRLTRIAVGTTNYDYVYDVNGNLLQETTSRNFQWDDSDSLARFTVQATVAGPASIEAQYLYDAAGQRVKKWVRNQQGDLDTTVYVGGLFEHQRWQRAAGSGENTLLHVMDNQSRIAIVRDGPRHPDDQGVRVAYHLGDYLGSSNVVIGGDAATATSFVSREEYYPYGESSFGSFGKKRYRFAGKERDQESGLYYHGARYYASWLARWISADQMPQALHVSQYLYGSDNPLSFVDPDGNQDENATSPAGASDRPTNKQRVHNARTEFLRGVASGLGDAGLEQLKSMALPFGLSDFVCELASIEIPKLGDYDREDRGETSWNPMEQMLNEFHVSDQFAERGLDLLRAGEDEKAYKAFGNSGYWYGKFLLSAVNFASLVGGLAKMGVKLGGKGLTAGLEKIGKAKPVLVSGRSLTWVDGLRRFFIQDTARHPGVGRSWGGRLLKRIPILKDITWEQGHILIQRKHFRIGGPSQIFDTNANANRGLARLGNAGWNLLPLPKGLNRLAGQNNLMGKALTALIAGATYAGIGTWSYYMIAKPAMDAWQSLSN